MPGGDRPCPTRPSDSLGTVKIQEADTSRGGRSNNADTDRQNGNSGTTSPVADFSEKYAYRRWMRKRTYLAPSTTKERVNAVTNKTEFALPMRVTLAHGSKAEKGFRGRASLPVPEALTPGVPPTPEHDLVF